MADLDLRPRGCTCPSPEGPTCDHCRRTGIEVLEIAFRDLHRKAQVLAYEVAVRPQPGEDWEPVRNALDELVTELEQTIPEEK